jgi:hypothetical protein
MTGRIPARAGKFAGAMLAAVAALAISAGAASAESEVVYNNTPAAPLPGNVVSQAFQATQTSQFGGAVELAGTARKNGGVTVGMSSWACQKGTWTGTPECITEMGAKSEWPITLSINQLGPFGEVGPLLKTVTKTFNMPYRPSESRFQCKNSHGAPTGAYYFRGQCFHGKYFRITFGLSKFVWPSKAIISISYNTSGYGTEPQGYETACAKSAAGCFYDSLNVGLTEPPEEEHPTPVAPSVGSDPRSADAYQNTKYAPFWCDGGAGGTGTFRLDAGCWTGYQPLFLVKATL